jgi:hypothetical protein
MQLQAECLDSRVALTDVLRKALVVARKLAVSDFQTWIERELNGYEKAEDLPPYRRIAGHVEVWDPYQNRFIPMVFENTETSDVIARCRVLEGMGEVEDLIAEMKDNSGWLEFHFTPEQERTLKVEEPYRPTRRVQRTQFTRIVHAVRNAVLNWTLKLESDGIVGSGLTFNAKEVQMAALAHYTTNNFFGAVSNSQIQQGSPHAQQRVSVEDSNLEALSNVLEELKKSIDALQLTASECAQVNADVEAIESQLKAPKPNQSVIRELVASITNIIEGCAGSLLAAELLHKMGVLGG